MANPSVLDAYVLGKTSAGGAGTITQSFTVSSGASYLVVSVSVKIVSPNTISVTWNGTSVPSQIACGYDGWVEIFALATPATGTHNVVVTFTSSPRAVCGICTVQNAGAPRTGVAHTQSLNTGAATTVAGDLCLAAAVQNSNAPTVPASWTDQGTDNVDTTTYGNYASFTATGTSTTAAFGGTNGDWCGSALLPFPAAGGGGGRTLFNSSALDGLSTSGPKQFNPLQYHRHPMLSLAGYRREQARKHREFMAKVRRAA